MKSNKYYLFAIMLSGCATMMPELVPTPTIKHIHNILVTDLKGIPINGAQVKLVGKNQETKIIDTLIITDETGLVTTQLNATSDPAYPTIFAYSTTINYDIKKDGYYNSSTYTMISKSGQKYQKIDTIQSAIDTVMLKKPIDFFAESYLSAVDKTDLKAKILAFIDEIRIEGFLANSYLVPFSIELSEFKEKKYLKISFSHTSVYNSLKLNKYDIGKTLFDEVVRKILNPLNKYISDPQSFYGYDVTIFGYTKDFSNKYASDQKLEYKFIMPERVIKKYKDKEITGQGLVDSSVVLLDDERIDIKFQ